MEDPVQPEGPVGLSVIHNSFPGVFFDVNIYALNPPKQETKVNFSRFEEFQQLASKKKTSTGELRVSRRWNTKYCDCFYCSCGYFLAAGGPKKGRKVRLFGFQRWDRAIIGLVLTQGLRGEVRKVWMGKRNGLHHSRTPKDELGFLRDQDPSPL